MAFRSLLFWPHLILGIATSIVILLLSVTGVLLTYEAQIINWLEKPSIPSNNQASTLNVEQLAAIADTLSNGKPITLIFEKDSAKPIEVQSERHQLALLNPYTGETLKGAQNVRQFFNTVTQLHRWFALEGESRKTGRFITGLANLIFVFLFASGLYLWLPRVWKWSRLKYKIIFNTKSRNTHARDFNWHHVFSFWAFIPLLIICLTGIVISYPWASKLLYSAYGEEQPKRLMRSSTLVNSPSFNHNTSQFKTLDYLLQKVRMEQPWQRISIELPKTGQTEVGFKIDNSSNGRQLHKSETLIVNRTSGAIISRKTFSDRSPAQQAQVYMRFLHTGESLGIIGQTLAGLASLAACFLVYTGLTLSYRRFFKRKKKRANPCYF